MVLRYLRLMGTFFRVSVQNSAAYRLDFFMHIFFVIGQAGAELIGLWTIYSNTETLAGWGPYEMLALLGVFRIIIGIITFVVAPNMRAMMDNIRTGVFDYVVLKPVNVQFLASLRKVVVWRVADFIAGAIMLTFAAARLNLVYSAGQIAAFVVMLACGAVVVYCVWLALATCAFWFTRISNIEMVFWNLFEAARYPVDIYRPSIRWGLTYIIPLAMLTTLPAATFLGRLDTTHVAGSVALAALMFALTSWFWRVGLRRYTGASA